MNLVRPMLALTAFAALAPAVAFADSAKVSDLIDELQRMQVKVAQGDKAAYSAEVNQLKTIGAAIAAASPETWKNKREADSLVIYILSGGSLANVEPLLKGDALIEAERSLARGAFAYVTSHEADAIAQLEKTDLTAIDARLAGEVAFARSVLETKRDSKAAIDLLDWSRLLAPGGLVEEAALRREIALLAEAKDVTRLAMLTRAYVTRFSASLYAADFLRDLAGAVVRLGLADDPANYKLIASGVASLPPEGRRGFLLNLAKSGIINARFAVAASAATEALEDSKTDSAEAMRARLYLAAGRLFSDSYDAAIADLRTLSESNFDRSDASLLSATRRVAAQLRIVPDLNVFNTENAVALPDAGKEKPSGPALTIAQAKDALQRTSSFATPPDGSSP
jgi:chemotaxis protein MotC